MAGTTNESPDSFWLRCGLRGFPNTVLQASTTQQSQWTWENNPICEPWVRYKGKNSPALLVQVVKMGKGEMFTWLDTVCSMQLLCSFFQLPTPPPGLFTSHSRYTSRSVPSSPTPNPLPLKNLTHQVMRYFWPQAPLCIFNCIKWCLTKDLKKKSKNSQRSRASSREHLMVHLWPQKRGFIAFLFQGTPILKFIPLNQLALHKNTQNRLNCKIH